MLETEDSVAQSGDGMDPFGRLVVKHRKLVEERDAPISQIRGQLGLEGFLKAPSFTSLRSATKRSPVIIINHCKWRSDILIIFHNSLPCSIPTANDFYARANKLRDELIEARKHGLDSVEYQDALSSVLKGLYELVGEPHNGRYSIRVNGHSRIHLTDATASNTDATASALTDAIESVKMDATGSVKADMTASAMTDKAASALMDVIAAVLMEAVASVKTDTTKSVRTDTTESVRMETTASVKTDTTESVKMDATTSVKMDTSSIRQGNTHPCNTTYLRMIRMRV
ncbi:hypothetical protein EDB83DRAFT_2580932 [Lactarius deliciosus]|nr:hypothetical protein EDB83DRAFT_2580932 [Lactarius deliciosus]